MSLIHNKNLPLVSICIPTYNGGAFIVETLESALQQTYSNIEIVITDDKSSDNTLEICYKYAKKDSRIKIFENNQNLGLVGNWCESIEKASSKWVKFLFQDDLLSNDCVEKMITTALQKKVNFVICNRTYYFEKGIDLKTKAFFENTLPKSELVFKNNTVTTPKETAQLIAPYLFKNCIGEPPTFLFNTEHYNRNDFPLDYYQMVDYIFILNKILVNDFIFLSEKLVTFRVHNSSESMRNQNTKKDTKKFHKYIYVEYYERIKLCYELLNNPKFKGLKNYISEENIHLIKNWYTLKSYKNHGFKAVLEFYKTSDLNSFILDKTGSSYNYFQYRLFKKKAKKVLKKYAVL